MATAFVRVLFFALTLKLLAALSLTALPPALPYSPCRTCHIENLAFSKNILLKPSALASPCRTVAIALVAVGWHLTC